MLLSATGNAAALVILPWIVLDLTGRAADAGIVAAATAVPLLLAGLVSGAIVDRIGRRRTAVVSDLASAASFAAIPIASASVGLSVGLMVALAAVGAVFDPAGVTAKDSLVPGAARAAGRSLDEVNGWHEATWGVAFLAGPGVAGLLIAAFGATSSVWIVAGAFLAAAVAVTRCEVDEPIPDASGTGNLASDVLAGIRVVAGDRLLRFLAISNGCLAAVYLPVTGVLLPARFEDLSEPRRLGGLLAAISAGAVVGSLASSRWVRSLGRQRTYRISLVGSALALGGMAFAFESSWPLLLAFGLTLGVAFGPVQPSVNVAVQTRSDEEHRGRVTGLMIAAEYVGGPVGYIIAGVAADEVGVTTAFVGATIALMVVATFAAFAPAAAELDDLDVD